MSEDLSELYGSVAKEILCGLIPSETIEKVAEFASTALKDPIFFRPPWSIKIGDEILNSVDQRDRVQTMKEMTAKFKESDFDFSKESQCRFKLAQEGTLLGLDNGAWKFGSLFLVAVEAQALRSQTKVTQRTCGL